MMTDTCWNEGTVSRAGIYTKLVHITSNHASDCIALVKPDTDFGDRFRAFDIDTNEWISVIGWICEVTDVDMAPLPGSDWGVMK